MNDWERNLTGSDSVRAAEGRSVEVGEDRRNVLPEIGAEEQADSLDEANVAIVMEIPEVIERGRKDKLPAFKNLPKKKLLEEIAEVDKVLSKFKTHTITKSNELLFAGSVVVTNRLGVKIDKVAGRKEQCGREGCKIRLKSLGRT